MQENRLLDDEELSKVSGGAGDNEPCELESEHFLVRNNTSGMIHVDTLLSFDSYTVYCPNGDVIGPKYRDHFVKIINRGPGEYRIVVHLLQNGSNPFASETITITFNFGSKTISESLG